MGNKTEKPLTEAESKELRDAIRYYINCRNAALTERLLKMSKLSR